MAEWGTSDEPIKDKPKREYPPQLVEKKVKEKK